MHSDGISITSFGPVVMLSWKPSNVIYICCLSSYAGLLHDMLDT